MPNIPDQLICPGQLLAESALQICNICSAISELAREISNFHDKPQDLSEKLISLKISRNLSHDRLASRMPIELISRIFALIDNPNDFFDRDSNRRLPRDVCVPALLSKICTRWREIALATPQLWTNVYLNLQKHSVHLDLTKEWLLRSGSIPLNLRVYQSPDNDVDGTPSSDLIDVIRSHSARWEYLNFRDIGSGFPYRFFHNLHNVPSSEFLDIRISTHQSKHTIYLHTPLSPRRFHSQRLDLVKSMPFNWENLIDLEVSDIHMDDIVHIVEQAPKLQSWSSYNSNAHSRFTTDPRPVGPTIHRSLKTLALSTHCKYDISIFQRLTLPSLQSLSFVINCHDGPPPFTFDSLKEFIDRSELHPESLSTFQLRYQPDVRPDFDGSRLFELTMVTHLHIRISVVEVLSDLLSRFSDIGVFPHLQSLKIDGPVYLNTNSWDILCDFIVEQNANIKATTPAIQPDQSWHPSYEARSASFTFTSTLVQQPGPPRPLRFVGFMDIRNYALQIKKETFLRLREAQREGPISLKVGFHKGEPDLLAVDLKLTMEEDGFVNFKEPTYFRIVFK